MPSRVLVGLLATPLLAAPPAARATDAVAETVAAVAPAGEIDGAGESCAPTAGSSEFTVCFAPKTDPGYVEEIARRVLEQASSLAPRPEGFQFNDGNRWSRTASATGLGQGDPSVLTWSYLPDGTSICGYAGEGTRNSNLQAWLNGTYGSFATWHALFQLVFDDWSSLTGITYVYESNDDGRAFSCPNAPNQPGILGTRGDIRIGGHRIDGNGGILAYNFFPNSGDMVIDTSDGFLTNTSLNSRRLRNTVAHEHGHGLGLDHVCPIDNTKLMEPFLSTAFDGVQHDDTLAGNRGYGDRLEHNDATSTATPLGVITAAPTQFTNLSVDDNSDGDDFSISVVSPILLTVDVTPVGWRYRSGPQNGDGSCSPGTNFSSDRQVDLAFDVIDTDGTTVLTTVNATGLGAGEVLTDFTLAATGTYYLRVYGDNRNVAQLYDLQLTSKPAADAPVLSVAKSVSPILTQYPVGSTVTYTIDVTNTGTARANGVQIQDCLDPTWDPVQVTPLDGGILGGGTAPAGCTGSWITWTLAIVLDPTMSASVRFQATIPVATVNGTHVLNDAVSSSIETSASSNQVEIVTCAPNVAFFKQIDQLSYAEGDLVTFTLTIANTHLDCDITNLVVSDVVDLTTLEDVPTLTWIDPPGATSTKVGNTITWTFPSLAASTSVNITIQSRVRAGTAGGQICNDALAAFDQSLAPRPTNQVCADITGGCATQVPRITTLLGTRNPTRNDVQMEWTAATGAQEYDLWRVDELKTEIPNSARGAAPPVVPVTGCADPAPTTLTRCVDTGAIPNGVVHFYQVRGVCGGIEGAL